MKRFTLIITVFLFFSGCNAVVFDASQDEQSKTVFENRLARFQTAKRQENKAENAAIIQYCDMLKKDGLEVLQDNPKIVKIAQFLLIHYALRNNAALLKKTFNMDQSAITAWVNAKLAKYSAQEIVAAQFLLLARMKDFMGNLSGSLKWGLLKG